MSPEPAMLAVNSAARPPTRRSPLPEMLAFTASASRFARRRSPDPVMEAASVPARSVSARTLPLPAMAMASKAGAVTRILTRGVPVEGDEIEALMRG